MPQKNIAEQATESLMQMANEDRDMKFTGKQNSSEEGKVAFAQAWTPFHYEPKMTGTSYVEQKSPRQH